MLVRYIPASRMVMALHAEYSSHPLRYQIDMYQPHSLLWGDTGRAVLAFLTGPKIEAALKDNHPRPPRENKLPPKATFMKELLGIRERGYALTMARKTRVRWGWLLRRLIRSVTPSMPQHHGAQGPIQPEGHTKLAGLLLASTAKLNRGLIGDHIFHPSGAHALARNATLSAMDDRSFM